MRNLGLFYIAVVAIVVVGGVIWLTPTDVVSESQEMYANVPKYLGSNTYAASGYEGIKSNATTTTLPQINTTFSRNKNRVSGLSHGKEARQAAQVSKEIAFSQGEQKISTTSSQTTHSYGGATASSSYSYSSIHSANTVGSGIAMMNISTIYASERNYNTALTRRGLSRRNVSPIGGTGDKNGERGSNGIWDVWLDEYIDYWVSLDENEGKDKDDATDKYLWSWWEETHGEEFVPDFEWTTWADKYLLSPINECWGWMIIMALSYVLYLKFRLHKIGGGEKK